MKNRSLLNVRNLVIIIVVFAALLSIRILTNSSQHHYVDINNLVKEAYTTNAGYNSEVVKHMSLDVYKKSNINEILKTEYPAKKADLIINEVNQHKYDGDVYVYMLITLYVKDKITDKVISAGIDIPVVFKVTNKDGQPFLADKVEYVSQNDVPQKYK